MTGDAEPSDGELLVRTASGDRAAFDVLVRRHIRAATLLAVQYTGDRDDAEDAVQAAFIVVFENARGYDPSHSFSAWLHGMVRRVASQTRARETRRIRLWSRWGRRSAEASHGSVAAIESGLELDSIRAILAALPPMQRACAELVLIHGFDSTEVASMHGIAESTVRQHVFRARNALKQSLHRSSTEP